jgi:hypothetical protein
MSSFDRRGNLLSKIFFEPGNSLYRVSAANWCIASQRLAGRFFRRVHVDIVWATTTISDIVLGSQQIIPGAIIEPTGAISAETLPPFV